MHMQALVKAQLSATQRSLLLPGDIQESTQQQPADSAAGQAAAHNETPAAAPSEILQQDGHQAAPAILTLQSLLENGSSYISQQQRNQMVEACLASNARMLATFA